MSLLSLPSLLLEPKHDLYHFFRTKPPLGFRRGTPISPLKPLRPASQDSLRALLAWEDLGGRIDLLSCKTRTVRLPRFTSLGGLGSRSRNFRFWLTASLLLESEGIGAWTAGLAASISSGSSSGSGVFLEEDFGFAGVVWPLSLRVCGDSAKDLGFSTDA